MKIFCFLLVALVGAPGLQAQTNVPASADPTILIDANSFDSDLKSGTAVYLGNVRVSEARMKLTCEKLTVKLPSAGGRIEHITAEDQVVIDFVDDKGRPIHGKGNKAVYTYTANDSATNEVIELRGDPMLETVQGTLKGDIITYDRLSNRMRATNPRMLLEPGRGKTNAPAASPATGPRESPGTNR